MEDIVLFARLSEKVGSTVTFFNIIVIDSFYICRCEDIVLAAVADLVTDAENKTFPAVLFVAVG